MGFFEPFSEDLAWADRAFIERHDPSGWVSGHPDTAPYFLEYLPLLKAGGGIAGFDPTYSYAQYFVTRHVFPSPRPYLSSLMDLAGEGAKTPVLGFCRSLGRLSWLKSAYPSAVNIVLVRNPVQQWLSAYQFKERDNNEYFLLRPVVIAQNPGENAHMRRFFQVFGRVLRGKQFDLDTLWGTFLNVYGAGLLAAVGHADLGALRRRTAWGQAVAELCER
jgi:acyl-CoA synthetase (AMP-forming)/AMP-acid ligase II